MGLYELYLYSPADCTEEDARKAEVEADGLASSPANPH